ncbi:MAG: 4Fe-4S dicluster domain-containing protein [Pseudodesulfovibrio sp.]|uniref:4Fe-4S ferredoxin iron-sulfur binding domain protein n=1 Tax=Pseudodesulfovibrio aespoeensis (strain ATCC 700646 / DSM 10631 / Aspo-2) TaxID=643562 RepID=E6VRF2_PSEA9|nr:MULTISPECIES: 4Fe-4S dicluster domain-containing protein [Pseudodesulfovibrio]MBU4193127.1 4Fe-4S dicluster domain-containing protein [Pseudomonadota bacterium]ADU61881.1 4Fe-4S ferredoxin iron-sulfur binding domain protein [Pseudodesulfovibrio aespoeensis Aspo-2]MBU4244643.1 4Fe-4S dicluster domain-containing protein [Pseudomonadota bacterium]MBU4378673.1 4Fe-4S dicluster domain-containing protein [Pseudomonadota bacterium]MBU4476368.1 4Fe-4S dicluster domain-containing protein [Pseudomona
MKRRNFLGLMGAAGVTATLATKAQAAGNVHFEGYPGSKGVLFDATRCIGCRKCEVGCNEVNNLPAPEKPFDDLTVLDATRRTQNEAYTVVNKFEPAGGPPVFSKIQCMHCLEPSCASACFVAAFSKDPSGAVTYDESVCVGCRYCMVACPFEIPTYTYNDPITPKVVKCDMCDANIKAGRITVPGCVAKCPKEALVFGERGELIKIARNRIEAAPDKYVDHIYGEREMGGTSWLYLSGVPFSQIGLREDLGVQSGPELTSGALSVVAMVPALWPLLLAGVYGVTRRTDKINTKEKAEAVAKAIATTQEKAKADLKTAMDRAQADKEATVKREVAKALEEAAKAAPPDEKEEEGA